MKVVQAKTQGCWLGDKCRLHDRLAWHIKSKKHTAEVKVHTNRVGACILEKGRSVHDMQRPT